MQLTHMQRENLMQVGLEAILDGDYQRVESWLMEN